MNLGFESFLNKISDALGILIVWVFEDCPSVAFCVIMRLFSRLLVSIFRRRQTSPLLFFGVIEKPSAVAWTLRLRRL
jgi:hypothetical protein